MAILSAIVTTIGSALFEFSIFLLVDSIVKFCLKSLNDQRQRCHIWACEALTLLFLSCLIYAIHHVPYLLLSLASITFACAILQYFYGVNDIQLFMSELYLRFSHRNDWEVSSDYEELELDDSSILMKSSRHVHARPTIHRGPHSAGSFDTYISPIRNRIESPTNFTPKNIARTSTPRSDKNLSVKSKFKSWVGINPYVNLPPGLPNRGNNMCFLNSVIQCLAHTPLLVNTLRQEAETVSHITTSEAYFLKKLSHILEQCAVIPGSSDRKVVDNVPFCNAVSNLVPHLISNPRYGPQQQQDAAEILLWLLNKTNEVLTSNQGKRNGPLTRGSGKLLNQVYSNKYKWRNRVINKLLHTNEEKEINKLDGIKKEEDLKIKRYETMHSLSCIDSVGTLSDVSWVKYCRNHPSVITDLFAGQLAEVRQSSITNEVSFGTQAFHILPVPLVDPRAMSGLVHLQDCIVAMSSLDELGNDDRSFSKKDVNSGRTTFNQSRTDSISTHSNTSLVSNSSSFTDGQFQTILRFPPNCLILQLNRFFFDQEEKLVRKIRSPVNILQTNLDLSCLAYDKKNKNSQFNSEFLYDLYGICVHEGSSNTQYGHYLALCQIEDGNWYKFDDELVTQINVTYECNSQSIREGAYLLFYKRQNFK